jgi:ubiquitin carboxyl-terminal hydrolase L5
VQNACGTQAVLSILLNRPDIEIGPALEEFKEFTAAFPVELLGEAISNSGTYLA